MSTTTARNKNLIFIITALLLTNIAVLVYFLWIKEPHSKPPPSSRRNGMTEMLQKEVGFDSVQLAQYKVLKDTQWAAIRPMFDQMRKAKDSLFHMLSNPGASDSEINGAADVIAQNQKALDLRTLYHFKRVRALCLPEQQLKYDSVVFRMLSRMGKPPKKNDNDKKD